MTRPAAVKLVQLLKQLERLLQIEQLKADQQL
jgi:hypothetical protein